MLVEHFLEPSDEEILEAPSEDSESNEPEDDIDVPLAHNSRRTLDKKSSSDASLSPSPDPDAGGWGASKQDYYDADVIETEADALEEEREARRLQQKQLQQMTEADYGFDEIDWTIAGKEDEVVTGRTVVQSLGMVEISEEMSADEKMDLLRTNYPEFEPLAKEFLQLRPEHEELTSSILQAHGHSDHTILSIKHRALGGYLSALCIYFAIFTSGSKDEGGKTAPLSPIELRNHPVMDILVKCRSQWERAKALVIPIEADAPSDDSEEDMPLAPLDVPNGTSVESGRYEANEEKAVLDTAKADSANRRRKRLAALDKELASLSVLANPSRPSKAAKPMQNRNAIDSSDLGDPTALSAHEAAAKASRKKSLKFYTAQIAGKASRRDIATKNAGGDEDLPYRERLRDRQERLTRAAQARAENGKLKGKDGALGTAGNSEDEAVSKTNKERAESEENDGAEGYYNFISQQAAEKKAAKAAAAALQPHNVITRFTDDTGAPLTDGKRGITYAIEKNKGLAPKRKKEVRNPRVKKRKKFEQKTKRLSSIRKVYKPEREGKGG